jgi:hypothetical protein
VPPTPEPVIIPEDLAPLDDQALGQLADQITARFDHLNSIEGRLDEAQFSELGELATGIQRVRAERETRDEQVATERARREELAQIIHGSTTEPDEGGEGEGEGDEGEGEGEPATTEPVTTEPPEPVRQLEPVGAAVAAAVARELAPFLQVLGERLPAPTTRQGTLAEARRHQPAAAAGPPQRLTVHAGADIPKVARGQMVEDLDQLAYALRQRAKSMPVTHTEPPDGRVLEYDMVPGAVVATIDNDYQHVIDGERTNAREVEELWHELVDGDQAEALLAGGGWCAPSETRYDFYNITCTDGLIDLPSFGVQRGGIKFPVSPSFKDLFTGTFSATGIPWMWTEIDDIATVTGAPNKPCVRVPCPSFSEVRLECYGLCVTAGNLTNDAYPEATTNYLRYAYAAHERAVNARYIQQMLALSTAAVSGTGMLGAGAISIDLPAAVEWEAIDYRAVYNMCDNATLEVVFPYWVRAVLRTDISARTGREALDVSNAEIDRLFTSLGVRPQFVKDWQMRGAGTNQPGQSGGTVRYPSAVTFLLYSAGTFVRGNGLQLDLGVVRDSVLNAENDYTAAWMEECHLIARLGHEARQFTLNICAAGRTGNNDLVACRT